LGPVAFTEFSSQNRWCAWRLQRHETKQGVRWKKVPFIAPEIPARTNTPSHWLCRARADDLRECFDAQGFTTGLGLLLGELADGLVLVLLDLDACRNVETGVISGWGSRILEKFSGSYAEQSPSGSGLHVLFLLHRSELAAINAVIDLGKDGRKWARPAAAGEKAQAIELKTGGYTTVSFMHLPPSPHRIRPIGAEPLLWLLREAVPEFLGQDATAARGGCSAPATAGAVGPAAGQRTARNIQMMRASRGRAARLAIELDDSEFQFAAALWSGARKSEPGWLKACAPLSRLLELPSNEESATRSSATFWRAQARLAKRRILKKKKAAVRSTNGKPGKAAEFRIIPLLVRNPNATGPMPDVVRMALATWRRMVWTLRPFALRVAVWLWATRDREPFGISAVEIAGVFGVRPERAAAALAEIVVAGLLIQTIAPDAVRRLPGTYQLAESLTDELP
jgi:hypothetical protein